MYCKFYTLVLFSSVIINWCESRSFRFDYYYYPNVEGWLKFHHVPVTWREAFQRCDNEGAVLASPSNINMKLAMISHMRILNDTECPIFTGVHATFSKGDFYSIEGKSLEKMPVKWTVNEPDNANNTEDCIIFLEHGTIADVTCSEMFPYMCFKKKDKSMVMTSCGTVDKDYAVNPKTGNCYKFHRIGKTWKDAFMTCSAEGGYLAIVNDDGEAQFLHDLHKKHNDTIIFPVSTVNKRYLFLGAYDWGHSDFRTIHGIRVEDAGYAKWKSGFPHGESSPCVYMDYDKHLTTGQCGAILPFICEKSPDSLLDDPDQDELNI